MDEEEFDLDKLPPGALVVNEAMLRKRLIWDIVPCNIAERVAEEVGLSPASPDVEDMEHRESHARLDSLEDIAPIMRALSKFASEAVNGAMIVTHGDEARPTSENEEAVLDGFIYVSTLGVVAELLDLGVIHLSKMERVL